MFVIKETIGLTQVYSVGIVILFNKCSRLKQAELLELKRDRVSFLWECLTCMKDKFPFHSVDDTDIVSEFFNSNFKQQTANFVYTRV